MLITLQGERVKGQIIHFWSCLSWFLSVNRIFSKNCHKKYFLISWILLQQIEKLSTTTIPLKGIEQGNSGVNLVCFFTLFLKNNATLSSYFYWHQFVSWYVFSFNYCSTKKSCWRQTTAGMWGWHFGMWTK